MPKPVPKRENTDWRADPSTRNQHLKLLLMLKDIGVVNPGRRDDIFDYEREAVDWVNSNPEFDFTITALEELSKSEIQQCFEVLD